jgi:hypothetical protein
LWPFDRENETRARDEGGIFENKEIRKGYCRVDKRKKIMSVI